MRILVAYDGSKCADAAIEDLKRAGLPREGELLVVSIADDGWPSVKRASGSEFANPWADTVHEAETFADRARVRIESYLPGWKVSSEALWGSPAKAVLRTIDWWKPDLLVVGSHGRSPVARLVIGSVSLDLIHHAPCPVRVVRDKEPAATGPIRILVGVDGSPASQAALREVARRSWPEGTKVRVVSVIESVLPTPTMVPALESSTFATEPAFQVILAADESEHARLVTVADSAAAMLEGSGLTADPVVLDANPRTEILAEAKRWHADTIFVGARGLGTLDRLLIGSVSTAIITHADCSVEVVRHAS